MAKTYTPIMIAFRDSLNNTQGKSAGDNMWGSAHVQAWCYPRNDAEYSIVHAIKGWAAMAAVVNSLGHKMSEEGYYGATWEKQGQQLIDWLSMPLDRLDGAVLWDLIEEIANTQGFSYDNPAGKSSH